MEAAAVARENDLKGKIEKATERPQLFRPGEPADGATHRRPAGDRAAVLPFALPLTGAGRRTVPNAGACSFGARGAVDLLAVTFVAGGAIRRFGCVAAVVDAALDLLGKGTGGADHVVRLDAADRGVVGQDTSVISARWSDAPSVGPYPRPAPTAASAPTQEARPRTSGPLGATWLAQLPDVVTVKKFIQGTTASDTAARQNSGFFSLCDYIEKRTGKSEFALEQMPAPAAKLWKEIFHAATSRFGLGTVQSRIELLSRFVSKESLAAYKETREIRESLAAEAPPKPKETLATRQRSLGIERDVDEAKKHGTDLSVFVSSSASR